jgi:hypothetical protein
MGRQSIFHLAAEKFCLTRGEYLPNCDGRKGTQHNTLYFIVAD